MSFLIVRNDLSLVEAEFIRPREWIESLGLMKGARLDLAVPELGIDGLAEVTAVRDCPPIADGEGRVVTGKFVTRDVANVVRVSLANGTEIRATDVHPVWSVDREDWVPAGKLEPGEQVDTLTGPVAVASVEQLDRHPAVYNLEVHGEHVYHITVDGVLVHNAGPGDCLEGIASNRLFRGGTNLNPRLGVDVKKASDGLIHPLGKNGKPQGLSLNIDPKNPFIQTYGGAFPVDHIPEGLQVLQSGNPGHYVVAPASPMAFEAYHALCNRISLLFQNVVP